MDSAIVKGKWHQLKGEAKRQWGKLTDDQLDQIDGSFEKMVGMVQEAYGKERDEAEKEVKAFRRKHDISQT
jgi:uncharacterized protein YjbJ (UPF0337 family)